MIETFCIVPSVGLPFFFVAYSELVHVHVCVFCACMQIKVKLMCCITICKRLWVVFIDGFLTSELSGRRGNILSDIKII